MTSHIDLHRLGDALHRAARISGIDLHGLDPQALACELNAAGLLLTPERDLAIRTEVAAECLQAIDTYRASLDDTYDAQYLDGLDDAKLSIRKSLPYAHRID